MSTSSARLWNKVFLVTFGMAVGYLLSLTAKDNGTCIMASSPKVFDMKRKSFKENNVPRTYKDGIGLIAQSRALQVGAKPRKILLDCGANVASTVQLFRETYPDGEDYIIHSFELDERLAPYFASYSHHILHCPVAVAAKNGNVTAYAESSWKPNKGNVSGKDKQWGGGSIHPRDNEKRSEMYGRRFGIRKDIPMIDLSSWIKENTDIDDYVIFKLDVEGTEYEIIDRMLKEGTFKWVDKFYGEFHNWAPVPDWPYERKLELIDTIKNHGITMVDWQAERKWYSDMNDLHEAVIPQGTPGFPGRIYRNCSRSSDDAARLALTVQTGMNVKAAFKLVETIRAHHSKMPVTLFVYGDFAQLFPDLVTKWSNRYTIGIRENQPYPTHHWELQNANVMRMSLVASVQRLKELGLPPVYYLPANLSYRVKSEAKNRRLRIVQPTVTFPPRQGSLLLEDNYYKYNDVERTPKALRVLYERISDGGILSLDSDHPDSYMISVFLMDYLFKNPRFSLVSMDDCLS